MEISATPIQRLASRASVTAYSQESSGLCLTSSSIAWASVAVNLNTPNQKIRTTSP